MSKRTTAAANAMEAAAEALRAGGEIGDADDDNKSKALGPLFSLAGETAESHAETRVYRVEPVDEGHLDDLSADGTGKDIKRRWGGGLYKIQAVTAKGKILATDHVKISGDPLFEDELGRRRYEKWMRQQFPDRDKTGVVVAAPSGPDPDEVRHRRELERLRLEMDAKAEAEDRRRQRERADREEERKHERELEERRLQAAREERAAEREREREERRLEREAARETEERRYKADQERLRLEAANRADPMQQLAGLATIMSTFGGGQGGGGPEDATTALLSRLPDTIREIRETGIAMKAEDQSAKDEDGVRFEGDVGKQAQRAAEALQRAGKDPGQVFGALFERVEQAVTKRKPKAKAPAPSKPAPKAQVNGAAKAPPVAAVKKHATNGKPARAS